MQQDLTQGSIRAGLIRFSLPLIAGNLLQQLYNVADTLIVGRFLGNVALAAVGSAFSLMILSQASSSASFTARGTWISSRPR